MKTYGIKDLCDLFSVGEHTVLSWIRSGQIRAINVSRKQSGRPKWRITADSLDSFVKARTPTPPPPRASRRKRPGDAIITFYK